MGWVGNFLGSDLVTTFMQKFMEFGFTPSAPVTPISIRGVLQEQAGAGQPLQDVPEAQGETPCESGDESSH